MKYFYISPKEAELIACLINKAIDDCITLTGEESSFAQRIANSFHGIKSPAKITMEAI